MQSLADRFSVVIVRTFGAAGHRKELIDAVSSFGVKSILCRDIITLNKWFLTAKIYVFMFYFQRLSSHVICPFVCRKLRSKTIS